MPAWRQAAAAPARPAAARPLPGVRAAARRTGSPPALRAAGAEVVEVRPGDASTHRRRRRLTVRPGRARRLRRARRGPGRDGVTAERIVHAWALRRRPRPTTSARPRWAAQDRGFFSLLAPGAGARRGRAAPQRRPARHAHRGHRRRHRRGPGPRPEHATVAGIARVVPLELPVAGRPAPRPGPGRHRVGRRWLRASCAGPRPGDGRGRAVPARRPAPAAAGSRLRSRCPLPERAGRRLRDGGVYVITGGLGGIGITLAEDLAVAGPGQARAAGPLRPAAARASGTTLDGAGPDRDRVGRAIAAIRRMEAAGAEVLVLAADVTDPADLRRVRPGDAAGSARSTASCTPPACPAAAWPRSRSAQTAENGCWRPSCRHAGAAGGLRRPADSTSCCCARRSPPWRAVSARSTTARANASWTRTPAAGTAGGPGSSR